MDLSENNEYGYSSLVKAANQILDKIELENRTFTKITSKQREENRLWNAVALREATINAIVHNDFSNENSPKFEIFADRIEITSAGGLPEGFTQKEFFEGYSVPRNKQIMRIFKDLNLVEHLGSGIPRILESYGKECFIFSENFLRVSFPSLERVTPQVAPQVKQVAKVIIGEMSRKELQNILGLSDKRNFVEKYLLPSIESKILEMTIPEKPNSRLQKYRLTKIGLSLKRNSGK